ncbi:unnamed protein product [Miscanthus lutarioriparius]|uniref:Ureide permease 2 n=1 Tax=Miscanthus lutarioriparius TaxID=422564 RepID=A0A811RCL0_9POAL|nr:unnamed protein product [Miscanthus lutarioriparius]
MLASLFVLGTFPALLTLLERRGQLPRTRTSTTPSPTSSLPLPSPSLLGRQERIQDNWPSVLIAMAGGVTLGLGNLISQYAWAFAGLSVSIIICSCMAVVIGTTTNYFLDGRINRAEILFPGVACFLVAVFLGTAVHCSNARDNQEKLRTVENRGTELSSNATDTGKVLQVADPETGKNGDGTDHNVVSYQAKAKPGIAEFIIQIEQRRSIKVLDSHKLLGLGLIFLAGTCFGTFLPAINLATDDQCHVLRDSVPHLLVYTAFFYFSLSCLTLGVCLNIWFLYRPMAGVPASTVGAYLRDWNGRHWVLLSGTQGCSATLGTVFSSWAARAAGYTTADAVQALPLVSTFWGVVLFGEYRRSSRRTYMLACCLPACCPCSSSQLRFSLLRQGIGRHHLHRQMLNSLFNVVKLYEEHRGCD